MFLKSQPMFIKTETPLHMGSGTDLGIVDMPIQREKHTSFPKIEASGLKGSLREAFSEKIKDKEKINILFGPEDTGNYASTLGFSDGKVLFYPVKSMKGIFAWITCEDVLYRFIRDMKMCFQDKGDELIKQLYIPKANSIISTNSSLLVNNKNIILEEFTYTVKPMSNEEVKTIIWIIELLYKFNSRDNYDKEKMLKDIVVLSGDDFKDFVNYSTEVITRTRIGKNGTVESGALFTEEYLPINTIIYSLLFASPIFSDKKDKKLFKGDTEIDEANNIISYFTENLPSIIQLGGNATLGKGLVTIATGGICNG